MSSRHIRNLRLYETAPVRDVNLPRRIIVSRIKGTVGGRREDMHVCRKLQRLHCFTTNPAALSSRFTIKLRKSPSVWLRARWVEICDSCAFANYRETLYASSLHLTRLARENIKRHLLLIRLFADVARFIYADADSIKWKIVNCKLCCVIITRLWFNKLYASLGIVVGSIEGASSKSTRDSRRDLLFLLIH